MVIDVPLDVVGRRLNSRIDGRKIGEIINTRRDVLVDVWYFRHAHFISIVGVGKRGAY